MKRKSKISILDDYTTVGKIIIGLVALLTVIIIVVAIFVIRSIV